MEDKLKWKTTFDVGFYGDRELLLFPLHRLRKEIISQVNSNSNLKQD